MKKALLSLITLAIAFPAFAQWTNQSGTGNYYLISGTAGIGTTLPGEQLTVATNPPLTLGLYRATSTGTGFYFNYSNSQTGTYGYLPPSAFQQFFEITGLR
jgi:hypothetical protein